MLDLREDRYDADPRRRIRRIMVDTLALVGGEVRVVGLFTEAPEHSGVALGESAANVRMLLAQMAIHYPK